jgi:DNA end-binding protein Ku
MPSGKDNFITVEDEELDAIKIRTSYDRYPTVSCPLKEIDPAYIVAPYYNAPEDKVSQEASAVIRDAMLDKESSESAAWSWRGEILEPYDKGIRGFTLRYASEVRDAAAYLTFQTSSCRPR